MSERPYSLASARFIRSNRDNWTPSKQTQWQRSRMSGPIYPMVKRSWWKDLFEKLGGVR